MTYLELVDEYFFEISHHKETPFLALLFLFINGQSTNVQEESRVDKNEWIKSLRIFLCWDKVGKIFTTSLEHIFLGYNLMASRVHNS